MGKSKEGKKNEKRTLRLGDLNPEEFKKEETVESTTVIPAQEVPPTEVLPEVEALVEVPDEAIKINNEFNEAKKNIEKRLAREAREAAKNKKHVPVTPKSAAVVAMDWHNSVPKGNNRALEHFENNHVSSEQREKDLQIQREFEDSIKRFESSKAVEPAAKAAEESVAEAAPVESTPEAGAEMVTAEKKDYSKERFPMFNTKYLDKNSFAFNEVLIRESEEKESASQAKLTGLADQLSEIAALREIQKKGLEKASGRLGKSSITEKVRETAQRELDELARREAQLNAAVVKENARLATTVKAKESYKQKAEDIRVRVAERMHTFVSPLETQVNDLKERETKAQMRIDRFKRERMHLSERLLDAKTKVEQAPLDSVRLPWKNWMKKATRLFDNIDSKLAAAEKKQDAYAQKRLSLELKIREWKELGEAFEKKVLEPAKEATPTAPVVEVVAENHTLSTREIMQAKKVEVPPELQTYIEKWNKQNGDNPKNRLTDDIAKWISKPTDRAMNQQDIERGVSEHFTVRRRGISTWPVISWVSSFLLKRRIAKLRKNG